MTNITIPELHRTLSEHTSHEYEYQKRFEDKLDLILTQVTKTNGRVTSLEAWRDNLAHPLLEDYKDDRSQRKGAIKLVTLAWSSVAIVIGLTFTLYIKSLKVEILKETEIMCNLQK